MRLRQERVVVDRQPVDRAVQPGDEDAWREQTIEVLEMSEEPVVQKRARVVEEVRIGKEATERTETVRDNVRHTEVKTEQLGNTKATTRAGSDYATNYDRDYETDFRSRYGASGGDYSTYAPAYQYGSSMAVNCAIRVRTGPHRAHAARGLRTPVSAESSWDRMKDAVRYGWEKVTGKR